MKKKQIVVNSANVRITSSGQLIKIDVADSYFGEPKWTFYVPQSTKDQFGFVPSEIIKSRMKHDFGVEIGHYSTTLG